MARGNSSRAASEQGDNPFKAGSPQKTEEGYRAELIEHFNNLITDGMEPTDLKNIPPPDLKVIAANVSNASDEARGQRDEFDRSVEEGEKAIKDAKFDWEDKRVVGNLVPLTFSEVQDGLEGSDVLQFEWQEYAQTDPDVSEALQKDREYQEEEGEPASLRGNSAVDAQFAMFAKGFIQDRIESASANRDDYDDEINTVEAQELEDQVSSWVEES